VREVIAPQAAIFARLPSRDPYEKPLIDVDSLLEHALFATQNAPLIMENAMVNSIPIKSISLLDFVAFVAADRKEAESTGTPYSPSKMVARFAALPGEPPKLSATPEAFGNIDDHPKESETHRYFKLLELKGLESEKEMYDKFRDSTMNSVHGNALSYDPTQSSDYKDIEARITSLKSTMGITDDSWRKELENNKLFRIMV